MLTTIELHKESILFQSSNQHHFHLYLENIGLKLFQMNPNVKV